MADRPPILMRVTDPGNWGLDDLADTYALRDAPGPGIRAVVTSGGTGMDAAAMDALPDLGLIALGAVGYDKVDIAYAKSKGIAVSNTPDVLTDDVADLALALMLAVRRRIPQYDAYVREGRWAAEGYPPLARSLTSSRIGILGLGRIGHAIATRAQPFAGEIAYFSRTAKADAPWRHEPDAQALAAWAQVLVVAVSGGAETAGLVDARMIEALGPDGVLVNIARGSVIDEAALADALVSGRLGGAGLDVFAHEPNVPDALIGLETVVLQPHQGSATRETRAAMGQVVKDNLAAFFAGKPLVTPV